MVEKKSKSFCREKIEEMQLENLSDSKVYRESRMYTLKKPSTRGHAITEDDFQIEVQIYNDQKGTLNENNERRSDSNKKSKTKKQLNYEPVPSTSGIVNNKPRNHHNHIQSDTDNEEIDDSEKCCVCGLFQPKELEKSDFIFFIKWAQCVKYIHWVHLKFCSPITCIRRNTEFLCPHCIA